MKVRNLLVFIHMSYYFNHSPAKLLSNNSNKRQQHAS